MPHSTGALFYFFLPLTLKQPVCQQSANSLLASGFISTDQIVCQQWGMRGLLLFTSLWNQTLASNSTKNYKWKICHLYGRRDMFNIQPFSQLSALPSAHYSKWLEQKTHLLHQVLLLRLYILQRAGSLSLKTLPIQSQTYRMNVKRVVAERQSEVEIDRSCLLKLTSRGQKNGSHSVMGNGPFTCLQLKWKGLSLIRPRGHLLAKRFAGEWVGHGLWFEQCFALKACQAKWNWSK